MKTFIISGLLIIIIIGCRMAFRKASVSGRPVVLDLEQFSGALYPVQKAGKWGYINNKMEMLIPPQFSRAHDFQEEMAVVATESDQHTQSRFLFGFIDGTGKLLNGFRYHMVAGFSQGLAMVMKDGKYGYINKAGEEVIPLQYEDASSFSEGLAVVKTGGKNGYIDKHGRMMIQPGYVRVSWVSGFSEGLASVYFHDNIGGYIDITGKIVIPAKYSYVSAFSEGLALVQPIGSSKYGFINKNGEMVIEPKYEMSLPFHEGVATVKQARADGSYFFMVIDKKGKPLSGELPYSFIGIFREGLAGVESASHRWGFIDKTGKEVIQPKFASARLFKNGLSMIQTGSLFTKLTHAYIDRSGNIVYSGD